MDSCLLRIPGSIKGKCPDNRARRLSGNYKVKILKRWNGVTGKVSNEYKIFCRLFDSKKIKENNNSNSYTKNKNKNNYVPYYEWIEKLLQTSIEEYRKRALWQILTTNLQ